MDDEKGKQKLESRLALSRVLPAALAIFCLHVAEELAVTRLVFGTPLPVVTKHLFIDDILIDWEHSRNARLMVNPPRVVGRILQLEEPFEKKLGLHYFSQVLEFEGHYRLYYRLIVEDPPKERRVLNCVAISTDGIRWEKPNLGLVPLEGAKINNCIQTLSPTGGFLVVDPLAPPEKRFKEIGPLASGNFGVAGCGRDGLRFFPEEVTLLPFRCDTQNVVLWDDEKQKFIFFLRGWKDGIRSVLRAESTTLDQPLLFAPRQKPFRKWADAFALTTEFPCVLQPDAEDWKHWGDGKPGGVDIYNSSALKYPYAPNTYLAFPSIYYHYSRITSPAAVSSNDGELEVQLAVSRDSFHWTRYRTPYVSRGNYDGPDLRIVCMTQGIIRRGDKLLQYFIGLPRSHGWAAFLLGTWGKFLDVPHRLKAWEESDQGGIYLAVQRVDGFVYLGAGEEVATVVTKPFSFAGRHLYVNVSSVEGFLKVALAGEDGTPFPGKGLADCDVIRVDSIRHKVTWQGNASVEKYLGKPVRLILQLKLGRLYSFEFAE